jgi:glucose-6-phosphate isomerase
MELAFDFTNLSSGAVGASGVTAEIRDALLPDAQGALKVLLENPYGWPLGWLDLAARRSELPSVLDTLAQVADANTLVTLGMGGSTMGTRALAKLFADQTAPTEFKGPSGKRLIVLDNLDEERLAQVTSRLSEDSVVLNPVSKSGTTLETVANFTSLLSKLEGAKAVVTTGEPDSPLGQYASHSGCPILSIPEDVGGRFSVLSPVGLFPLAFLGVDVEAVVEGALSVRDAFLQPAYYENPALLLVLNLYALATRCSISQMVFMPYYGRMTGLGDWWRQLFAESLGKRHSLTGKEVSRGLTPIAALGPRDQHSILQLLLEGPADKVTALVQVTEPSVSTGALSEPQKGLEGFSYLNGKRINDIVLAELAGTRDSLTKQGRPNYTVTFPHLTPQAAGAFLFFYEVVVGLLGVMLNVNPFDQPAVDEGKGLTREMLQKPRN